MSEWTVVGSQINGFAVLEDGDIVYDLLENRDEARLICDICAEGIGPEWDAVEPEPQKRKAGRK